MSNIITRVAKDILRELKGCWLQAKKICWLNVEVQKAIKEKLTHLKRNKRLKMNKICQI